MIAESAIPLRVASLLRRLPLLTLYLSERCNSRCVTCDYWRNGLRDMSLASVTELLPSLQALHTETVLISGGEPLLNPEWFEIAELLRDRGLGLWLLTSGLSLAKHVRRVVQVFDSITVSLDGTCRETYAAIRGVDAFDKVCTGIRQATDAGAALSLRVTLQRTNFRELPAFVDLAKALAVRQVSFLPVDVANPHAFARQGGVTPALALAPEHLAEFEQLIGRLEREHADSFRSGFIAESPQKLRRMLQYFGAILGRDEYPDVRCNAPEFSAVVDASLRVRPCFFIPGTGDADVHGKDLADALNLDGMGRLRASIRRGERSECATCVCPLWRDTAHMQQLGLPCSDRIAG